MLALFDPQILLCISFPYVLRREREKCAYLNSSKLASRDMVR